MLNFSRDQRVGHNGERWVFQKLIEHGYHPRFDPDWANKGFDLVVEGLPVEVKFAHKTHRKVINTKGFEIYYDRWQWFIHETSLDQQDWVLILVAEDDNGQRYPFIIPGSAVGHRNHIQLTSHPKKYRGWLKAWLDRWEIINYLANQCYQNGGPLFHEWAEAV